MEFGRSGILGSALDWLDEGRHVALATVIQTWGSAPQPVGSKLIVDGDGNFLGSVSGGCVEAAVIAEAPEVLSSGKAKLLRYEVEDGRAWQVGLACGGAIRILLEPIGDKASQASTTLRALSSDLDARRQAALVTDLATGEHRLLRAPVATGEAWEPSLKDALRRDKSALIELPQGEVFIDVFNPPLRIVVIGAVHVAQAMLPLAAALGYDIVIIDPRAAFANAARFGDASVIADWPDDVLPKLGVDARTAVVALAHEPRLDDPALIEGLRQGALYVGALGSKKTHAARMERLLAAGLSQEDIARIHAPIGLDIGAQGPAEIALSIIAEIVAAQRAKDSNRT